MELLFILVLLGGISGIFAGLLGIGGGIITVPALYYILKEGHGEQVMQVAVATSLAVIFVTTSLSTLIHHYHGSKLQLSVLGFLVPGLVVGCISGAELAYLIPSSLLREIFGLVAILIGLYFSTPKLPIPVIAKEPNRMLVFFGLVIGHLSSLLGIGGGIFTIPLLLAYNIPTSSTIVTSSAATVTTSFIGTITYMVMASHAHSSPSTIGFIDPVSFICISIGSLCTTPLGVKLALILPASKIKIIFGAVMVLTGIALILG